MDEQIRRVVHCHCDHFEPYGRPENGSEAVERWATGASKLWYFKNASLFHISRVLLSDHYNHQSHWLYTGLAAEERGMLVNLQDLGFDIQFHVHHEKWRDGMPLDSERLKCYLDVLVTYMSGILGRDFRKEPWFFVHGCWALNASDEDICLIDDEIQRLLDANCLGDFSFPAGRGWCNPTNIFSPFTVIPHTAPAAYDTPEAQPRIIGTDPNAFEPGRFLIWHQPIPYIHASLDLVGIGDVTPEQALVTWLSSKPIGDTIYIKTHAHSMAYDYFSPDHPYLPLPENDAIARLFGGLEEECGRRNIQLESVSARSLYDEMRRLDEETSKVR